MHIGSVASSRIGLIGQRQIGSLARLFSFQENNE